jgi:hypothetical protein
VAQRCRDWWSAQGIRTAISTTSSITGPDDGGVPLIYFGAMALVNRCSAGDRAEILVVTRDRRDRHGRLRRGIETIDLKLI